MASLHKHSGLHRYGTALDDTLSYRYLFDGLAHFAQLYIYPTGSHPGIGGVLDRGEQRVELRVEGHGPSAIDDATCCGGYHGLWSK